MFSDQAVKTSCDNREAMGEGGGILGLRKLRKRRRPEEINDGWLWVGVSISLFLSGLL